MGEGTIRMNGLADPVRAAEDEVGSIRTELGDLVSELDRRRQEAFDLRLQARRHPALLVAVVVGTAILTGGVVATILRSRRRRHSVSGKANEMGRALARFVDRPETVARRSRVREKLVAAATAGVAAALTRFLIERAVETAKSHPRPGVRAPT